MALGDDGMADLHARIFKFPLSVTLWGFAWCTAGWMGFLIRLVRLP